MYFQIASLETEKESMLTDNRAIAEENLEQEPKLIELRGRILDLTEQGKTLCAQVQEKLTVMSMYFYYIHTILNDV